MKRLLFFATLLPFCIKGQVIELREGAYRSYATAEPTLIMYSHALRHPDPERIMECKHANNLLLADVHTENEETARSSDEENGMQKTLFLFNDKDDIEMLTKKYPEANIRWCYISD